ncbi:ABC-type branched-subunit amino acid transport system substrate-binding protein [Bradyrhizobium elkanii]|jgi:branched-chain amino acid transport system substrate-binding protein|nr:hypothetical protein [Bradyrhizobium elkanii]WLA82563.1 hypothetical protein QNJ99_45765 [Bradyrhizobium elkanii]
MSSTRFAMLVGAVLALAEVRPGHTQAQDVVRVGLVMPLTGVLGPVGKQAVAGARLYMAQHGDMVAGRKIELIVRTMPACPTTPSASRRS